MSQSGQERDYQDFDNQDQERNQNQSDLKKDQDKKFQEELEEKIHHKIKQSEANHDKISQQLEKKLKVLKQFVVGKNQQQTLNIRMHQLAISKILVFTHNKSHFRIVQAHTHLGQAYLNYKCYQQAIDHLTIALKKNGNLCGQIAETKLYHTHILTLLGKCYLQINSYQDALQLLTKAISMQQKSTDMIQNCNNIITITLMSNCYLKQKKYKEAEEKIKQVQKIAIEKYGEKSQQCAFAYVQHAKIFNEKQLYQQAQRKQNEAIEILIDLNYSRPQEVAQLYQTLGVYQQKNNDIDSLIESLIKVKTIYQQIYGPNHDKVIKVKRKISIILVRNDRHKQALDQLKQTLQLEEKVYGENSVSVGKTNKVIGTIFLSQHNPTKATFHLKRALKIFQQNGMKKATGQIKKKMQLARNMKESNKGKNNDQID